MKQMGIKNFSKYVFLALFLGIIYISFLVLKPFLITIATSLVIAYIFYPVYLAILKRIKNKDIASLLTVVIVLFIIIFPFIFITNVLLQETIDAYNKFKTGSITIPSISELIPINLGDEISGYIEKAIREGYLRLANLISKFIVSLPSKIFDFLIMLFILFYVLKESDYLIEKIRDFVDIEKKRREILFKDFSDITYAIVFGLVLTALFQGFLGTIGFLIFGIPNAFLWGVVMTILAIIPFLGPALVWLPAGIIQVLNGENVSGFGLIIYGVLIISTLDNVVRAKIISRRANINPAIILLGLVGGVKLLGIIGIILGPLILSLFLVFIRLNQEG